MERLRDPYGVDPFFRDRNIRVETPTVGREEGTVDEVEARSLRVSYFGLIIM